MVVLLLGAGASKSYEDSVTKVKMPLANEFFKTFRKLRISEDPWVLIGKTLTYLNKYHNKPWQAFLDYDEDIEILHSEVQDKLFNILEKHPLQFNPEYLIVFPAYMELIFIFSCVINEIQNGPLSISHQKLASQLSNQDTIITFNWDTLMDKALVYSTNWRSDCGYYITPSKIYRNNWSVPEKYISDGPMLLKLHGSTNWLTSYMMPENNEIKSIQETSLDDFYIYESTKDPYSTYEGRFMSGYSDFAYGYYPPNLPLKGKKVQDGYLLLKTVISYNGMPKGMAPSVGLNSMPLIIPPVKQKDYSYFGTIFSQLWRKAEDSLTLADRIIVIGYSFPLTDIQTNILFKSAFTKRKIMPEVIIVDPNPEKIRNRFLYEYGIKESKIKIFKTYFNKEFEVNHLFK